MEIGGQDIIFDVSGQKNVQELVFNAIAAVWPSYVVTHDRIFLEFDLDCFVYMNPECEVFWDDGYDSSYDNTMIHVLLKENELTAVVGTNKSDKVYAQVKDIIKNLSAIFNRIDDEV